MPLPVLDAHLVCQLLDEAGFRLLASQVRIASREDCWLAFLPDDRLAWFAATDQGQARLTVERRVLRLIEQRCSFLAPRILYEDSTGAFDVRQMVPGKADPFSLIQIARQNEAIARSIGDSVGTMLAQQHLNIKKEDVCDWLGHRPDWPAPKEWIAQHLPAVVQDDRLIADADLVISVYEQLVIPESEKALVHSDVGFHNLGIDAVSYRVLGIFDYGEAVWADVHNDFRYLMYDYGPFGLLDAAIAAYRRAGGIAIQIPRILLYNACCAIMFLAYRHGHAPEEQWCGRTLAQDLAWTRYAVAVALRSIRSGELRSDV